MKKLAFINWKFENIQNQIKKYEVENNNLILASNYEASNKEDFLNISKEQIKKLDNFNVAVFLHEENGIIKNDFNNINPQNIKIKYFNFGGGYSSGNHPIYYDVDNNKFGLLSSNDFQPSIFNASGKIKKKNFEYIWNHYWNKLDLEKKKLIIHWLPLAIDIQGLSEVYQKAQHEKDKNAWKNKALEYWKDIKTSMENSERKFEQLLGEHNQIAGDVNEFKLEESGKKEGKLVQFLSNLDSTENDKLPEKYLDPKDKFFFPNWLEDYVRKLNEKTEK